MEYLIALVERWREEAVLLETRYGSPELAALARAFADELAAATGRVGDAVWSVSRAATETGRSRGHIYALIEEGALVPIPGPGEVRLRAGDVLATVSRGNRPAKESNTEISGWVAPKDLRRVHLEAVPRMR